MAKEQKATGEVKARVLVDCEYGKCNSVVTLDAALAKTIPHLVDTNAEAVAYAESIASGE